MLLTFIKKLIKELIVLVKDPNVIRIFREKYYVNSGFQVKEELVMCCLIHTQNINKPHKYLQIQDYSPDQSMSLPDREVFDRINSLFGCLYRFYTEVQQGGNNEMEVLSGSMIFQMVTMIYERPVETTPVNTHMESSSQSLPEEPSVFRNTPPVQFILEICQLFFKKTLGIPNCRCCKQSDTSKSTYAQNCAISILSIIYSRNDNDIPVQLQLSRMMTQIMFNAF